MFYRKMTTLRTSTTLVLGALAALVAGCGGSNEPPPKDPNSIEALMSTPAPSPTDAAPADVAGKPDESSSRLNKPQKEQMEIALRRVETKAAQCPDVVPGMRGMYGGRLRNAHQVEALTANLIAINRRYKAHAGVRVTDV